MRQTAEWTDFCTINEAARRSGLAPKTWYQGGAGTATVPRIRFGRSVRLLRKDVEDFINTRIAEAEQAIGSAETSRTNALGRLDVRVMVK